MTLKQINDYLIKEGYLISIRGKPILTNKYFRGILSNKGDTFNLPVVIDSRVAKVEKRKLDLVGAKILMKKLVEDSMVPHRIEDGRGGSYTVKTYGKAGVEKFCEVMNMVAEGQLDYQILVASTRLYYARGGYKKTISNYFADEVWEGEYMEFKKKLDTGKVERHIKDGLDDGTDSKFGKSI